MRVGLFFCLAMLLASSAQAKPLHLLDEPALATGSTTAPPAVNSNLSLIGWSALEGVSSIATDLLFVVPLSMLLSRPEVRLAVGPLNLLELIPLGLGLLARGLTSLAVWGVDRGVPGNAGYVRTMPDHELARRTGRRPETVGATRRKLRIPAFRPN